MEPTAFASFFVIIVITVVVADKQCDVRISELQNLQQALKSIEQTIYTKVDERHDDSECRKALKQVNMRLKLLSQRYKLMNKGYVAEKEQQAMVEDYKKQLGVLQTEMAKLQSQLDSENSGMVESLKGVLDQLTNEATTLRSKLSSIQLKLDAAKKELCISYLTSKNLDKAIHHMLSMKSRHLMDMIQLKYDERKTSNIITLILFIDAYPDLDDRAEAFLRLLNEIILDPNIGDTDFVLLESKVLRMLDSVKNGSPITDEKAKQLNEKLRFFTSLSYNSFQTWANNLTTGIPSELKIHFEMLHPKQVLHLETIIHYRFLEENDSLVNFDRMRNFIELLGMSHGINKYKGAEFLLARKISYTLMSIMSIAMDDSFPTPADTTKAILSKLPKSIQNVAKCTNAVEIVQENSGRCIQITNLKTPQFKDPANTNHIGHFDRTVVTSQLAACTVFQIIPTPDKKFFELTTTDGIKLSAIDSFTPGIVSYTSYVGVIQKPFPGHKSQIDSGWLIEPNYANETVKVTSEFNLYRHQRTRDYLISENIESSPTVVLQRYGYSQLVHENRVSLSDWILRCSNKT
ncbi:uncharacterized protein LOC129738476 [Uranotaenia lowii]|uniref:uncharacterized protein LOC129738476 n=1 Tax=Uranotaenia lowii TaxID=190385 RepID=UPI0024795183|nr:uncharacterized protein LOC129738476 [Uranotaenia lowii]